MADCYGSVIIHIRIVTAVIVNFHESLQIAIGLQIAVEFCQIVTGFYTNVKEDFLRIIKDVSKRTIFNQHCERWNL